MREGHEIIYRTEKIVFHSVNILFLLYAPVAKLAKATADPACKYISVSSNNTSIPIALSVAMVRFAADLHFYDFKYCKMNAQGFL